MVEVLSKGVGRMPQASRPLDQENVVPRSLPVMDVGSTASLPLPKVLDANQSLTLRTDDGEVIEVAQQVQLYAPNCLLKHPLVSPALAYLGGLPPLFFIAGEKEVLRDEIIYRCVLFPYYFKLTNGPSELIGLHIRTNFRCVRRRRICTQLSTALRETYGTRQCTSKFTMVFPHS